VADNICYLAVRSVLNLKAKLLIVITETGKTANIISKYRPPVPILAITNKLSVVR